MNVPIPTIVQDILYYNMLDINIIIVILLIIFYITKFKKLFFIILFGFVLLLRSRYIETYWFKVKETNIEVGFTGKYILIADMHLGQNKKSLFAKKLVEKINSINGADAVFIAGDFMSNPKKKDLDLIYEPLKNIKYPLYAVLGNHDVGAPGPLYRSQLVNILQKNNVKIMNNKYEKIGNTIVVGLGDNWIIEDEVSILKQFNRKENVVVLLHNPDSILKYKNNVADVTLAGHTHCGQIKIPFIWKLFTPIKSDYHCGFYKTENTNLYVTAGVGETTIPFRLFNRSSIDIINLK